MKTSKLHFATCIPLASLPIVSQFLFLTGMRLKPLLEFGLSPTG